MMNPLCRFCSHPLHITFCNLGKTPFSNSFLKKSLLHHSEPFFPLHAYVCEHCFLVQLEEFQKPQDIFSDYAYFSSYSTTWLDHARRYVDLMVERFAFTSSHKVVEIASNDGYLLQYFQKYNIPVLGIEPAMNVAAEARAKGIPTLTKFFGRETAKELLSEGSKADLIIGNNVLAHVPDINDFVGGIKLLLGAEGIITMEFPHLLKLMQELQFDTIYHEHFSYLSFYAVEKIFAYHGLKLFDVDQLSTHGGSLRIYACHQDNQHQQIQPSVLILRQKEMEFGIDKISTYQNFEKKVKQVKNELLLKLILLKSQGKSIIGYGAPAKGNTLLNFCGIRTDFLDYTVDMSPYKQGLYLPGTHIPIYSPDKIKETKPDYILLLPWNLKQEITEQLSFVKEWGAQWIIPIPHPVIVS